MREITIRIIKENGRYEWQLVEWSHDYFAQPPSGKDLEVLASSKNKFLSKADCWEQAEPIAERLEISLYDAEENKYL